jgi:hypothetical protein
VVLFSSSCDKVTNPYPSSSSTGGLDWTLYPDGDSAHYAQTEWPVFTPNTNTLRNVLIEDYTGHRCNNCPNAGTLLHNLINANPGRVFGAGTHTSALGMSDFQAVNAQYPEVLYNDLAFEIGHFFGAIPGTTFQGNPHGAVNRIPNGTDNTLNPGSWTSTTNTALSSTLRVNLQSAVNYFPSTRGIFLHTEIDKIDNSLTNALGQVVYLIEDSLVAPQLMPDLSHNATYVHRDIMRDCIDGNAFGRTLTPANLGTNNKYYLNYSYKLPAQYNVAGMHLIIYVYDKTTYEIYQVIKQDIQ